MGHGIEPDIKNIATRNAFVDYAASCFDDALRKGTRLFAGFDFGFGFPAGAAKHICGRTDWQGVWHTIANGIEDDHNNKSNRFVYADGLNANAFAGLDGPFWGHPHQHAGRYANLEPNRPQYDVISEKRLVETKVKTAQPIWKLAYTGSVGSQTLLGIARLESLRQRFGSAVSIWPFETQFAGDFPAPVIIAEVYPSIISVNVQDGEVKDAAQVRTVASRFQALDAKDAFGALLDAPQDLTQAEKEMVLGEEGWIVGAGHHAV